MVNVDGAIFSSQKVARVGVIIQDHEDKFIVGLCKKIQAPLGAIEVKAKAFELGLLFAKKLAFWTLFWRVTLLNCSIFV